MSEDDLFRDAGLNASEVGEIDLEELNPRRELESNIALRDLLLESYDIREKSERGEICLEEATSIIKEADKVAEKARFSSTAFLDIQVLHSSGVTLKNCVDRCGSKTNDYKGSEYAEHLKNYLVDTPGPASAKKIKVLEQWALQTFHCVTTRYCTQLGAYEGTPTGSTPRVRQQRQRENLLTLPLKHPKNVITLQEEEENLEKHIKIMMNVLQNREKETSAPVPIMELVLNPKSFSQTIENIFHLSHIIKENYVEFYHDDDGLPMVKCVERSDKAKKTKKNVRNVKNVISIDMESYKELINVFGMKQPLIPTRNQN